MFTALPLYSLQLSHAGLSEPLNYPWLQDTTAQDTLSSPIDPPDLSALPEGRPPCASA